MLYLCILCTVSFHAKVCSVICRVLGHLENPQEHPLVAAAPAPRPQHHHHQAGAAATVGTAVKGLSANDKHNYDPHRTLATAPMTSVSSSAGSLDRSAGVPPLLPPRRTSLTATAPAGDTAESAAARNFAAAVAAARGYDSVGEFCLPDGVGRGRGCCCCRCVLQVGCDWRFPILTYRMQHQANLCHPTPHPAPSLLLAPPSCNG